MKRFAPILPLLLITLGCAPAQAAVTAGAGAGAGDQALNPVAEVDASGTLQAVYVYATRGHVPSLVHRRVGGGWQHLRLLTDPRGSARMAVDTTHGDIVWQASYTTYGERTLQVEAAAELIPFGFAGGLHDEKTGLVRFGARDLDPKTGRWTTPDPLGFSAGDTNLYAYAGNDPINFIDPTGLQSIGCTIGGLAGLFLPFGDLADALREALSGNFGLAALSVAAMAFPVGRFGRFVKTRWGWRDRSTGRWAEAPKVNDYPDKLPFQGEPGSTARGPTQSRRYGEDGFPKTDRDHGHADEKGLGRGDHAHDWGRPEGGGPPQSTDRGPSRPTRPSDPPPPRQDF